MADVIITLKIMPASPEVNLDKIEEKATHEIKQFGGKVGKVEREPVAFGMNAIKIIFIMDETKGDTEPLERAISAFEDVSSVEVIDVRRAIG